jgi:excisionase family DNA binding protein
MFHIQNKPQEDLKNKEFLTVKQVAQLMGLSVRTAYRIIGENKINAIKLSERKTIIKRTDIDVLFETPEPEYEIVIRKVEKIAYQAEIKDCYTIGEIQDKFGISDAGLYQLLKRENISKFTQGKFTYVAKRDIDNLLQMK